LVIPIILMTSMLAVADISLV